MNEKKYSVIETVTGQILAKGMDFDIAIVLIRGYRDIYFNQPLNLTIVEESRDCVKEDLLNG